MNSTFLSIIKQNANKNLSLKQKEQAIGYVLHQSQPSNNNDLITLSEALRSPVIHKEYYKKKIN
jgi:hypothetical protein